MRVNWPKWFAEMWRADDRRWAVINSYQELAKHKDLMTDIALRNNVFAPIHAASDREAWIAEGRRQCALELFMLANVDPGTLFERTKVNRTKKDASA